MKLFDKIRYPIIFILMFSISIFLVERTKTPNNVQQVKWFENNANDDIRKSNLDQIRNQLSTFYTENNILPDSLSGLTDKIPMQTLKDPSSWEFYYYKFLSDEKNSILWAIMESPQNCNFPAISKSDLEVKIFGKTADEINEMIQTDNSKFNKDKKCFYIIIN